MLDVRNLTVRYGRLTIVDDVSFSVEPGQWLMIVGPNGAGKSTVLNAISGGVPYTGSIRFEGQDLLKSKPRETARKIGVLNQKHFVGYAFTVEEIVRLGRYAYAPRMFSSGRDCEADKIQTAIEENGSAELP